MPPILSGANAVQMHFRDTKAVSDVFHTFCATGIDDQALDPPDDGRGELLSSCTGLLEVSQHARTVLLVGYKALTIDPAQVACGVAAFVVIEMDHIRIAASKLGDEILSDQLVNVELEILSTDLKLQRGVTVHYGAA